MCDTDRTRDAALRLRSTENRAWVACGGMCHAGTGEEKADARGCRRGGPRRAGRGQGVGGVVDEEEVAPC